MDHSHPLTLDTIPFAEASTLAALFALRCARTPQAAAYREYDAAEGRWRDWSWNEVHERAQRWRAALAGESLAAGDRVAVMLRNCVDWVCFDQAAQALGLVVVPLYPTDNPENQAYILGDCGARVLLLGESARWQALQQLQAQMPALLRVVCTGPADGAPGLLRQRDDWLRAAPAAAAGPAAQSEPEALATIVYTSGTTGKPKGVMLSHRNILTNVDAVLRTVQVYREDLFLSFLPLSHALERTCGYYLPMVTGSTVAFARSVQDLAEDLLTVRPTALVSVPRIYERVYAKMQQSLAAKGAAAHQLFEWAQDIGWRRHEAEQHGGAAPGPLAALAWPALQRLVADKLHERLGGRLRIAVSGGAPVSARLMHCFLGLGVPVLQGYGLTEASPIVSANRMEDNVPESVGRPIPGVEVRLGDRDEVLVRGPNVMMGYWQSPQKTREAIDAEGWLHTGDIGRLDAEGRLYITGRLKDILVTSTGEKVPPGDLELAIAEDPLFEQVMVLGESRPFLSALAVLNTEGWVELATQLGLDPKAPGAVQDQRVEQAVLRRIERPLAAFPSYARVRRAWVTLDPWTVDDGLVTPTLKLRRRQVEQRFAGAIGRLYEQAPGAGR